jgi:pimeloyl-ACP methyl ester carboxylesterase
MNQRSPRIGYVTTSDGVRIAYSRQGRGRPLVWLTNPPFSHIQLEERGPLARIVIAPLLEVFTTVRFDPRGMGLSQRPIDDFSLGARMRDLEAVVEALGCESLILSGTGNNIALAISYTASHPERVSHLILREPIGQGERSRQRALRSLFAADWEMFAENVASLAYGWSSPDAREYAKVLRASITREQAALAYGAMAEVDPLAAAPFVNTPTLVTCFEPDFNSKHEMAMALASAIPNARLAIFPGLVRDTIGEWTRTLSDFLGIALAPEHRATPSSASSFRTILFTDLVDHTAMLQRLGDVAGREILRAHEGLVRDALRTAGGEEVKTEGDAFMASFASAGSAVACAIEIQRALAAHNSTANEALHVRIGLNAGEPIADEGDYFGSSVNLAARIAA